MAKKQKVITTFSRYNDVDLRQKAQFVVSGLTGNTNFPSPVPALTDVQAAIDALNTAIINAEGGDKTAIALRNEARTALQTLMENLALYVQFTAKDNIPALTSSGLDLSKPYSPVGVLPKPANFKVDAVNKGSVKLRCDGIYGANGYRFEFTSAPVTDDSVWTVLNDTKANVLVTDLASGKEYAFRMTAIGTDPTRIYSDEITSFVL